jgi:putative transposase
MVGWPTGPTIHRELVLNALLPAVQQRRPRGTIIRSDQGVQFGSDAWRLFCRSNHLEPSMSRKGNCWDNVVAESFFSSMKKERVKKRIYPNRELALVDIADYVEKFCNAPVGTATLAGSAPSNLRTPIRVVDVKSVHEQVNRISSKVW